MQGQFVKGNQDLTGSTRLSAEKKKSRTVRWRSNNIPFHKPLVFKHKTGYKSCFCFFPVHVTSLWLLLSQCPRTTGATKHCAVINKHSPESIHILLGIIVLLEENFLSAFTIKFLCRVFFLFPVSALVCARSVQSSSCSFDLLVRHGAWDVIRVGYHWAKFTDWSENFVHVYSVQCLKCVQCVCVCKREVNTFSPKKVLD